MGNFVFWEWFSSVWVMLFIVSDDMMIILLLYVWDGVVFWWGNWLVLEKGGYVYDFMGV